MKLNPNHIKAWQLVRDHAAESSAILQVIDAEQWAKKLEGLITSKADISAATVYSAIPDNCDSGYQASSAYSIIQCYWEHADLLIWKNFGELCKAAKNSSVRVRHSRDRQKFTRRHSAQSVH